MHIWLNLQGVRKLFHAFMWSNDKYFTIYTRKINFCLKFLKWDSHRVQNILSFCFTYHALSKWVSVIFKWFFHGFQFRRMWLVWYSKVLMFWFFTTTTVVNNYGLSFLRGEIHTFVSLPISWLRGYVTFQLQYRDLGGYVVGVKYFINIFSDENSKRFMSRYEWNLFSNS